MNASTKLLAVAASLLAVSFVLPLWRGTVNDFPAVSPAAVGITRSTSSATSASTAMDGKNKRLGAVLGAILADAATMPLHWIYDTAKLDDLLASKGKAVAPEFFDPPSCPFYLMPLGAVSPYGAETVALLHHLKPGAPVEGQSWAHALGAYFSKVYPGYKNHSIKTLLANLEAAKSYPDTGDADDTQANCLCKVAPVVAAAPPALDAAVEVAVRTQQNNATSVAYGVAAAKILEQVVQGASVQEAVEWAQQPGSVSDDVRAAIAAAVELKGSGARVAAEKLGKSCAMPGAFQVALVAALEAGSYEEGVRANMLAGGDNCSRANFVGALLGAQAGVAGLPADWTRHVTGWAQTHAEAERLVQ